MRDRERGKREIVLFVVKYVLFLLFFLLIIGIEDFRNILDLNGVYTDFTIRILVFLFKSLGMKVSSHGTTVTVGGFSMNVLFGCNGLEAFFIYSAGVLAFKSDLRTKVIGMLLGLFFIEIVNMLRLLFLGFIGVFYSKYFDYFHIYIAQGIMIAVALGVFMWYLSYASNEGGS